MHIGTVRPEEARIHDTWAGYHQFHAEETQAPYGSFEIFWHDGKSEVDQRASEASQDDWDHDDSETPDAAGWYWWACSPGCTPDGDASGPFATSRAALEDADEWHPEFDDAEVQEEIIYLSDEAAPCQMTLRKLFDNFIASQTNYFMSDILADMKSRGFYEGVHDNGRYCIILKAPLGQFFPATGELGEHDE